MLSAEDEARSLLQLRPRTHRPGSFPREYLPTSEPVLFETRPVLRVYMGPAAFGAVLAFGLSFILWIISGTSGTPLAPYNTSGVLQLFEGILIAVGILVVALAVLGWRAVAYVVTPHYLIRKSGQFNRTIIDCRLDKIQAVTLTQPVGPRVQNFGTLLFSLTTSTPTWSPFSGLEHGGILWRAVAEPLEVRAFIEQTSQVVARLDREGLTLPLDGA